MIRGGSRAVATSKMECFVIIVNSWKPLTIITMHSILDVAAALDPPLMMVDILISPTIKKLTTLLRCKIAEAAAVFIEFS